MQGSSNEMIFLYGVRSSGYQFLNLFTYKKRERSSEVHWFSCMVCDWLVLIFEPREKKRDWVKYKYDMCKKGLAFFCLWLGHVQVRRLGCEPGGPEGTDTSAISPQYGRVHAPEDGKTHTAEVVIPLVQMTRVAVEIWNIFQRFFYF